jgi:hypothetical protein
MKRIGTMILVLGLFLSAQTARADWSGVRRLTWTADSSYDPAITSGPGNTVHVVWSDYTPGNYEIFYKRSADGGSTWSANKRLTWTSGDSFAPVVAVDSGGVVHIVWYDNAPGHNEIYFRRSPDGGATWSGVKRLTWTSGDSVFPVIAIDTNDAIHIAWSDDTPGNAAIYYRQSQDGGVTWSALKRLSWSSGTCQTPSLAAGSGNAVHIAWIDDTPGNPEVYYRRSPDGGATWNAARRLIWTSGKSYSPALAINFLNAVYVFWEDDTPGNYELYFKRSADSGATWNTARRMTWTSGDSFAPAPAIDSNNEVHVVWSDYTAGNPDLYYRSRPAGSATWGVVKRLTWTPEDSAAPSLAIDAVDALHVVWSDFTPGNYEIYYRKGK